jgi:hypothetical protein
LQTRIKRLTAKFGATDGKTVGAYIEHKFKDYLLSKYNLQVGSSASVIGINSEIGQYKAQTQLYFWTLWNEDVFG